ncbi:MAG TPA: hypothetical protein VHT04_08580, partial [Stellaceae bacterium]|nr:hypothetical protein [Stellaceae bacterium]
LADCDQSLRLRAGDAATLDSRAFVHLMMRNPDLALADYNTAMTSDPKLAHSLYGRGIAKRMKGDQAGANADLAEAKRIDPEIAAKYAKYGVPGS